jgi:hypothetical protein
MKKCLTPECTYHISIHGSIVAVSVELPFTVNEEEAKIVEEKVHAAMEAALAFLFNDDSK